MPKFTYTGEDEAGKKVRETIKADDRFAVYAIARDQGHTVASIVEAGGGVWGGLTMDKINQALGRVKDDELIMVTRNLGSMLTAGLTVPRALSVIERQSKNPKLKGVVTDMVQHINQGDPFHETLAAHPKIFNDLYVSMVRAGEESGNLAESLQTLSSQMEKANNLKKKIKGAMIYPTIVVTVMVVIGILMMIYVMPQITSVFKGMGKELPATTQVLITVSDFMAANAVLVLVGIVGAVMAAVYFFRSYPGRVVSSWLVPRLPVIGGIAKEANAARTARTLSSLLHSGVNVLQSIAITEDVVQNIYYKAILHEAGERVEKGSPLSEVFIENEKLYPILVGEMILVGEETGQIAGMLGELALFYENEVERKTKDMSTIIEPILMVVIGSVVGFFALALIAPIYSIGGDM